MPDRGPRALLVALIFLVPILGGVWWIQRLARDQRPTPRPGARTAPPPRALPPETQGVYREIQDLQGRARFAEAAARYDFLLRMLEASWGADSEDLALYHYYQALAWKLAGDRAKSIETASQGLVRWPRSLLLRTAETTARAEIALERGAFDQRVHESFAALLEPDAASTLQDLKVAPETLVTLWADMLLRAGRPDEALDASLRGLALAPDHRGSRTLQAKALLQLRREREAIPVIERLLREGPSDELEVLLAAGLLDGGDAGGAWRRLEPLVARAGPDAAPGTDLEALELSLPYHAGRALNRLGRPGEAAEHLLVCLAGDPENPEALEELAISALSLGAREAADALSRRMSMLAPAKAARESEAAARRAGDASSRKVHAARRLLVTDRTGEALRAIEEGIALDPAAAALRLEEARIRLLLGRTDQAERSLRSALQASGDPACLFELARVKIREGNLDAARPLISEGAGRIGKATGKADTKDHSLAALHARTLLEMGRTEEAEGALAGGDEAAGALPAMRLVRAEVAVARGRFEEASGLLRESHEELPGGPEWARAISAWSAIRSAVDGGAAPTDASDVLDHPRFLEQDPAREGGAREVEAWLARLREVHESRSTILRAMKGLDDAAILDRWRELCDLYAGAGARRKARETAWYIVHIGPGSAPDWKRLARTLSAPEETAARLVTLGRALKRAPGDEEAIRLRREARAFLGLGGP